MQLVPLFLACTLAFSAGEKDTAYYKEAVGKSRYELKTALHHIIKDHTALKYDDLWKAFETTDRRFDDDTLAWDIYSNCDFPFYAHYGPNTTDECYQLNREHSFPNSWFGGEATRKEPKYNDLFHMYPVSGRVNSIRNDNPYGEVQEGKATYTSNNGSMRGPSATPGFEGTVFEPIDEYKGDLARTYFYMVTRYENEVADWDTVYNNGGKKACVVCNGTSTQAMQDWAVALFLKWHRQDPVSQKEINRNDSIFTIQHNRNPYIDFPELVEKIWGTDSLAFGQSSATGNTPGARDTVYIRDTIILTVHDTIYIHDTVWVDSGDETLTVVRSAWRDTKIYPNPSQGSLCIETQQDNYSLTLYASDGAKVMTRKRLSHATRLDLSHLRPGTYVVELKAPNGIVRQKIILL